jgi:hypothetical protein
MWGLLVKTVGGCVQRQLDLGGWCAAACNGVPAWCKPTPSDSGSAWSVWMSKTPERLTDLSSRNLGRGAFPCAEVMFVGRLLSRLTFQRGASSDSRAPPRSTSCVFYPCRYWARSLWRQNGPPGVRPASAAPQRRQSMSANERHAGAFFFQPASPPFLGILLSFIVHPVLDNSLLAQKLCGYFQIQKPASLCCVSHVS